MLLRVTMMGMMLSLGIARSLGNETLDRANSVKNKLSSGIAERARRLRGNDEQGDKKTE